MGLTAVLSGVLLPAPSEATEVPFAASPVVSTALDNGRVAVAVDLDGDADLDLLSASFDDDKIAWYENTSGSGAFGAQQVISTLADGPESVFAADIDGDGDQDVLSASSADGRIAWYENTDGAGSFGAQQVISTLTMVASGVVAADVDGDGDLDVLSCSFGDDKVAWYENTDGAGTFGPQQVISTTADGPEAIFVADMDGDGDLDVLSASFLDAEVNWYENVNGDGSSWVRWLVTDLADGGFSVSAADVDGDGDMDVLSASLLDDEITWYENTNGAGTSWIRRAVDAAADGAIGVAAADVDDDGDLDVLSAANFGNDVAWYENLDAAGTSWTKRSIAGLNGARAVAAADLDRDGDLDALAISTASPASQLVWYENRTLHRSAAFGPVGIIDPANTADRLLPADVDGDGDQDLLSLHSSVACCTAKLAWHENVNGDATSWVRHPINEVSGEYSAFDVADVDGDGDVDILSDGTTGAPYPPDLVWWENALGDGSVWLEWPIVAGAALQEPVRQIAAADLDLDGDQDVLYGPGFGVNIGWMEDPVLGLSSTWHGVLQRRPLALEIADFNGNAAPGFAYVTDSGSGGEPEVAVMFDPLTAPEWCTIEGSGTFYQYLPHDVVAADVDRDGTIDVVLSDTGSLRWFDYTPNPPFTCWSWTASEISDRGDLTHLFAADVDRDGDTDFLTSGHSWTGSAYALSWWENGLAEAAGFTEHLTAEVGYYDQRVVIATDLDGDGDPDLVTQTTDLDPDRIIWLENRGGQFALDTTDTAPAILPETVSDDVLKIQVLHRGRPGDSDLELATLELLMESAPGVPLTTAEANAIIENLYLYDDTNQSGSFEAASDTLVHTVSTLTLSVGGLTLAFTPGDANFRVAQGSPETFLVVLEATANASSQSPNSLRVTHVTESSSSARDAASGIPLRLEYAPNVASSMIQVPEPGPMLGLAAGMLGLCWLRRLRARA